MQMNITIDRGNTATKIVVWEGRRAIWRHTFPDFSRADVEMLNHNYPGSNVILCSVAGDDARFIELLGSVFNSDNISVLTPATRLPISIGYSTPETLGMDRVAAAVGGWTIHPGHNLLIVDVGTAVTYDVVTADGCFACGNIAPGIGMRLKALEHFTAKLPQVDSRGETPAFGVSTETAMRSGAVFGVVGEIMYYLSKLPDDTKLVITGGWGTDIARHLTVKATIKPCLVSIGLNSILSYNETK